ncbi:MAG: hypothetical protein V9F04_13010 [Dermatophilaceae bacterium]
MRFGAEGIGLCRTEHMFLGDRRELVERPHPRRDRRGPRRPPSKALRPLQRKDFEEIFRGDGQAAGDRSASSTRRCTSSCPTSSR